MSKPFDASNADTISMENDGDWVESSGQSLNEDIPRPPSSALPDLSKIENGQETILSRSDDTLSRRFDSSRVSFSSDSSFAEYGHQVDLVKPSANSSFFRRHKCKIITAGILIILTGAGLALIFTLMPQIAQAFIDGSSLSFQALEISQPSENGFNSTIKGYISNAGPINAKTDPMAITVSYEGTDIGVIDMPSLELAGGSSSIDISQNFSITNQKYFEKFSKDLLSKKNVVWRLKGQMDVEAAGFQIPDLKFDKLVTIPAMENFGGMSVNDFNIAGDEKKLEVNISATMENPSPVSMQVGDVSFDMYFDEGYVGRVTAPNLTIQAGTNDLKLVGVLVKPEGNATSEHFSKMFTQYLWGQDSVLTVKGANADSENRPAWLGNALESLNISVVLPGASNLNLIQNVNMTGLFLNFNTGNQDKPELSVEKLDVDFELPFDFPISVNETKMQFFVINDGQEFGEIRTDFLAASNENNPKKIETSIPVSVINLIDGRQQVFSSMLRDLFVSKEKTYSIKGIATARAKTPVGDLEISGLTYDQVIVGKGMQGLKVSAPDAETNPVIRSTEVLKGNPDSVLMINRLMLYSPSDVKVNLGDVTLDLLIDGANIGRSKLKNLTVSPGENEVSADTIFEPKEGKAEEKGKILLENFVNRKPTRVTMRGSRNASDNEILLDSISELNLKAPLPGLDEKMVKKSTLKFSLSTIFNGNAQAKFQINNMFGVPLTVTKMDAEITRQGQELASLAVPDGPAAQGSNTELFSVKGKSSAESPLFPVKIDDPVSRSSLRAGFRGISGNLDVSVNANIQGKFGEFPFDVKYVDDKMPASISLF